MKVQVRRIPGRKKPAPVAVKQVGVTASSANVVCIPIDLKRMIHNAQEREVR